MRPVLVLVVDADFGHFVAKQPCPDFGNRAAFDLALKAIVLG
jgi:hypothetical protein